MTIVTFEFQQFESRKRKNWQNLDSRNLYWIVISQVIWSVCVSMTYVLHVLASACNSIGQNYRKCHGVEFLRNEQNGNFSKSQDKQQLTPNTKYFYSALQYDNVFSAVRTSH